MINQPKLIDIEEVKKISNSTLSRYSSPSLNFKIFFMLKVAGIDPSVEKIDKYLKNITSFDEALRGILRYIVQHKKINYSNSWYQHLKGKINEFHRRYSRVNLIKNNNVRAYRVIFKLYIKLSLEYDLYNQTNTQELDYFIAAQFARHYHSERGIIGKVTIKIFEYKTCYDNYLMLKDKGYPPTLISEPKPPLYVKEPLDKSTFYQIKKLKDSESTSYLFVEKPILEGKIPRIAGLDAKAIKEYITALEFLMIRAKLLNRQHNRFILSIEHMRVYKHIQNLMRQ